MSDPFPPLTRAEREVVEAIATRAREWVTMYDEIGEWLGISVNTARTHVHHIAMKLRNPDRLEPKMLVWLYARRGVWHALYGDMKKSDAA